MSGLAIAFAPVALFFGGLATTTHNVPQGDDYISIFPFLCHWLETASWSDKLASFFTQYFSHRIALTRLVALVQYSASGEINFLLIASVGWAAWLAVSTWIAYSVAATRQRLWLALPVFLVLMQPQGSSNFFSAMQAVQNLGVVALALAACLAAVSPGRSSTVAAVILAAVAAFTSANGLLVGFVLVVQWAVRREWRRALLGALVSAVVDAIYFTGFTSDFGSFQPGPFLANVLAMAGNSFAFARSPLLVAQVAGAVLLGAALWLLLQPRMWQNYPRHAAFVLFLVASIFMAARGRIGWGADYMLQDRYRLYGLLLLATLLVLALDSIPPRSFIRRTCWATTGAAVFAFLSYASNWAWTATHGRWIEATAINHSFGVHLLLASGPDFEPSETWLARATRRGIYRFPEFSSPADSALLASLTASRSADQHPFQLTPNAGYIGYEVSPAASTGSPAAASFMLAVSSDRRLLLPVDIRRTRLAEIPTRLRLTGPGFVGIWPAECYAPGNYALYGLARDAHAGLSVVWTGFVHCPKFD